MAKRSKHTWVVDVIEDGSASVEIDGRMVTPVPAWMLPDGVHEGDVLSVTHTKREAKSSLVIEVDPAAKQELLAKSEEQVSRKGKNDRGGHIKL
ncbi:MAG TPA: DUF3006 domain-containing protein [Gemmatimonadaceae bacterium]|nr:DUF3006 domain-containing protein [Gemmatimonadaceae bacterium]